MTVVNEPGLYTLILSSRKPEAKAFKRGITHDVSPMIRKTGGYMTDSQMCIRDSPATRPLSAPTRTGITTAATFMLSLIHIYQYGAATSRQAQNTILHNPPSVA